MIDRNKYSKLKFMGYDEEKLNTGIMIIDKQGRNLWVFDKAGKMVYEYKRYRDERHTAYGYIVMRTQGKFLTVYSLFNDKEVCIPYEHGNLWTDCTDPEDKDNKLCCIFILDDTTYYMLNREGEVIGPILDYDCEEYPNIGHGGLMNCTERCLLIIGKDMEEELIVPFKRDCTDILCYGIDADSRTCSGTNKVWSQQGIILETDMVGGKCNLLTHSTFGVEMSTDSPKTISLKATVFCEYSYESDSLRAKYPILLLGYKKDTIHVKQKIYVKYKPAYIHTQYKLGRLSDIDSTIKYVSVTYGCKSIIVPIFDNEYAIESMKYKVRHIMYGLFGILGVCSVTGEEHILLYDFDTDTYMQAYKHDQDTLTKLSFDLPGDNRLLTLMPITIFSDPRAYDKEWFTEKRFKRYIGKTRRNVIEIADYIDINNFDEVEVPPEEDWRLECVLTMTSSGWELHKPMSGELLCVEKIYS